MSNMVLRDASASKKYIKLQFDLQVKKVCAVFVISSPFYGDIIEIILA